VFAFGRIDWWAMKLNHKLGISITRTPTLYFCQTQTSYMHHTISHIRQLLIDASASMEFHREDILDAIADHLGEYQRYVARHPQLCHKAGLSFFNTRLLALFFMVEADRMPEVREGDFRPEGDTALFDAISLQIDQIEEALRASGEADSAEVDLHIISDGVDTSSERIRFADLRARIEALQASGKWRFHFGAADLDTIELNSLLGLRRQLAEKTSAAELRLALVDFLTPGSTSQDTATVYPPKSDDEENIN
jgi:hypothetical protein